MMRKRSGRLAALFVLALTFATGCEQVFEPLQETDRYFSIYGYLDAAADTQWIRVMPVRSSIYTSPERVDASILLEHLGNGRRIVMADSLFSYKTVNLGGEDLHAHNFSTTEAIEPGATYRVTATRSDGAVSTAIVRVPEEIPTVVVRINRVGRDVVRIEGADHLAMVHVLHHRSDHPLGPIVPVYQRLEAASSPERGMQLVGLDRRLDPNRPAGPEPMCVQISGPHLPLKCEVFVVASGSEWPFSPLATRGTISHIDVASNVEGGVGFVGGIVSTTVPYENCSIASWTVFTPGDQYQYCDLTYDAHTATLEGVVTDEERVPIIDNPVVIREVEGEKVRTVWTDDQGSYRVSGLDPGVAYQVCVKRPAFYDHHETIVFQPGQRRTADVVLTRAFRLDGC